MVSDLTLVKNETAYHSSESPHELRILGKSPCIACESQEPCRSAKCYTEIVGVAFNPGIRMVKSEVSNRYIDGSCSNVPQGLGLASETDQRSALARWHIVACYRPSIIDGVLIGGDWFFLVNFGITSLLRRKRRAGVLKKTHKEGVTNKNMMYTVLVVTSAGLFSH